jgi:hypothetical protein
MKAHVLFDDEGNVGAMSHPKHGKKSGSGGQGGFIPGPGQHTALLDVPAELADLKPRDLHSAVRVINHYEGTPRLVAKA